MHRPPLQLLRSINGMPVLDATHEEIVRLVGAQDTVSFVLLSLKHDA